MSSKSSQVVLNPGTVSAIKTQFEKLCNAAEAPQTNNNFNCKCSNNNRRSFGLPSSHRSNSNNKPINIKSTNNNNNNSIQIKNKPPVPIKTFRLQRSITSLELQRPSQEQIDNFRLQQQNLFRKSFQRQVTSLPLRTPEIEAISTLSTDQTEEDELKPLPPLSLPGTKSAALLTRCTVDPVKRNSIKRSPAFRVGDKQNNAVLLKQLPTSHPATTSSIAEHHRKSGITKSAYRSILHSTNDSTTGISTRQLNNFLAQRCSGHLEQMQQPGMTDSIRAALLRPLPSGPPPKKPPRTSEIVTGDKANKRNCA